MTTAEHPPPWSPEQLVRVERLCAVLSRDPGAAPDLAQETFLLAWRIRDRLVDPAGTAPWLDAIARNVCRRWRVQRGRGASREQLGDQEQESTGYDPIADYLEREELHELLDRALALLPAESRAALVGRYVDERPPAELAADLGTTPEAVSMRLVRGRARLRAVLENELADEPLAEVWRARYGVAWRATRLPCPDCGTATLGFRRDQRGGVVELRCPDCAPSGVSASYRLDNPVLGPLLADARRPSTVVTRMHAWVERFWSPATSGAAVPCTRCAAPIRSVAYHRAGPSDPRVARGWETICRSCGEGLSVSLGGLLLSQPETRALRRRRPGVRAVPTRHELVAGRPSLVVGFRDAASGEAVDGVVDGATSRLLLVAASGVPVRRLALP